ncbi:TPA: ead/Ea22-like family protein [Escherichia coli]
MNKIDYQALREAAEKATCGVWSLEYGEERFDAGDALIHREVVGYLPICRIEGAHPESGFDEDFQMEQQANAEFIAAANPATVLALLGELEAAKKRIAELEAELVSQTYKLNELSGNSPVTPDGWVMVPKELTPEMMRAVQIRSELGGYATSNLSGAYNMFFEFWNVAVSAAPKVDDL